MTEEQLQNLKYPIGKYTPYTNFEAEKEGFINDIVAFPAAICGLLDSMSPTQLETPYRPGGWTISQLVHHCADSHMNAFIRCKLALTEDNPMVKGYEEQLWALGPDYTNDINSSLGIIKNLHKRWEILFKNMTKQEFERSYVHSQTGKQSDLRYLLSLYSWHCKHHLGHIQLVANI
jgi:hypothetical protein